MPPIRHFWVVLLALTTTTNLWAQGKKPRPEADKSPLEAKLVAKTDTYTIPAGQQGKEFAEKVSAPDARELPEPPTVDFVLELKNPTDAPIAIMVGSDAGSLDLEIKGPGAVSVAGRKIFTREFRLGKKVEIAAGKTYEIPIKKLQFGFRGVAQQAYWTEPGDYKIVASLRWPDAADDSGRKQVGATSAPITVKVEAPK
jgi:hypothetical protein